MRAVHISGQSNPNRANSSQWDSDRPGHIAAGTFHLLRDAAKGAPSGSPEYHHISVRIRATPSGRRRRLQGHSHVISVVAEGRFYSTLTVSDADRSHAVAITIHGG